MQFFKNDLEGLFLERPNRFIVIADTPAGKIRVHCPNPGRLIEILTPGRKLIFQKSDNPERKTPWSLVAAYYKDKIIPLNSVMANKAALELVIPKLFPDADKVLAEQSYEKSRFDFLIHSSNTNTYLEVKSCTLVEEKRAMDSIKVDFVSISCDSNGNTRVMNFNIPADMDPVRFAEENSGIYMVIIKIKETRTITTGKLKYSEYQAGYYVYAGSAKTNLSKRIKRHRNRKKKTFHWHIDYLTASADEVQTFGIYTDKFSECDIAKGLSDIGGSEILNFGSSDCSCSSHLYYFKTNPIRNTSFLELLHYFRHSYSKK